MNTQPTATVKHWRSMQDWALQAKALGYPECRDCHEPLRRKDWERGICWVCRSTDQLVRDRTEWDRIVAPRAGAYDSKEA